MKHEVGEVDTKYLAAAVSAETKPSDSFPTLTDFNLRSIYSVSLLRRPTICSAISLAVVEKLWQFSRSVVPSTSSFSDLYYFNYCLSSRFISASAFPHFIIRTRKDHSLLRNRQPRSFTHSSARERSAVSEELVPKPNCWCILTHSTKLDLGQP